MAGQPTLQQLMDQLNSLPAFDPASGNPDAAVAAGMVGARRDLGPVEGGLRQVLQGIPGVGTWSDELGAAGASVVGGHGLDQYSPNLNRIQDENRRFQQTNPGESLGANFLGGGASLLGAALVPEAALPRAAAVVRGAALGTRGIPAMVATDAGIGALQGEGNGQGNPLERAGDAGIGALTGAGTGIVGAGVGAVGNQIGRGVQGFFNRRAANSVLPGAASVGDYTGRLPQPDYGRLPDTLIGDLTPRTVGLGSQVAGRNDPASDTLMAAYKTRQDKNNPRPSMNGAVGTPNPNPQAQAYQQPYDVLKAANAAGPPPNARQGLIGTVSGAVKDAAPLSAAAAAGGAALHMAPVGAGIGGAYTTASVIKALADRMKQPAATAGAKLGDQAAQDVAGILGMPGKVSLNAAGKPDNPEINDAIKAINAYVASKQNVKPMGDATRRVFNAILGGAVSGDATKAPDQAQPAYRSIFGIP